MRKSVSATMSMVSLAVVLSAGCGDDGGEATKDGVGGTSPLAGGSANAGSSGAGKGGEGRAGASIGGTGASAGESGEGGAGAGESSGGAAGAPGAAGEGGGGGKSDVPEGCTEIELQQLQYDAGSSNEYTAMFNAMLATQLGGAALDTIYLSVISEDTSDLELTGSFELGQGVEANYATCVHCVVIHQDSGTEKMRKYFYPVAGTFNIAAWTPPADAADTGLEGSLVGVQLVEVTIDFDDYTSTPVEDGECQYISNSSFDAP